MSDEVDVILVILKIVFCVSGKYQNHLILILTLISENMWFCHERRTFPLSESNLFNTPQAQSSTGCNMDDYQKKEVQLPF